MWVVLLGQNPGKTAKIAGSQLPPLVFRVVCVEIGRLAPFRCWQAGTRFAEYALRGRQRLVAVPRLIAVLLLRCVRRGRAADEGSPQVRAAGRVQVGRNRQPGLRRLRNTAHKIYVLT